MLIATILGVCLVPVLFVTVEKITGRGKHAKPEGGPAPAGAPAAGGH
jgi:hypothetical protein